MRDASTRLLTQTEVDTFIGQVHAPGGVSSIRAFYTIDDATTISMNSYARPGVDLHGTNFQKVDMDGVRMREANLSNVNFNLASIGDANLERGDLRSSLLLGVNLAQTNLESTNLQSAQLSTAILDNTSLYKCDMQQAVVREAILTETNLEYADIRGTSFEGSYLRGVKMNGCTLSQQTNLTNAVCIDVEGIDERTLAERGAITSEEQLITIAAGTNVNYPYSYRRALEDLACRETDPTKALKLNAAATKIAYEYPWRSKSMAAKFEQTTAVFNIIHQNAQLLMSDNVQYAEVMALIGSVESLDIAKVQKEALLNKLQEKVILNPGQADAISTHRIKRFPGETPAMHTQRLQAITLDVLRAEPPHRNREFTQNLQQPTIQAGGLAM